MKNFTMPRGTGKTISLIRESNRTGAIIVCSDTQYVIEKAEEMNLIISSPIRYKDFLKQPRSKFDDKYLIDELDSFLETLSIIGYTRSENN